MLLNSAIGREFAHATTLRIDIQVHSPGLGRLWRPALGSQRKTGNLRGEGTHLCAAAIPQSAWSGLPDEKQPDAMLACRSSRWYCSPRVVSFGLQRRDFFGTQAEEEKFSAPLLRGSQCWLVRHDRLPPFIENFIFTCSGSFLTSGGDLLEISCRVGPVDPETQVVLWEPPSNDHTHGVEC